MGGPENGNFPLLYAMKMSLRRGWVVLKSLKTPLRSIKMALSHHHHQQAALHVGHGVAIQKMGVKGWGVGHGGWGRHNWGFFMTVFCPKVKRTKLSASF